MIDILTAVGSMVGHAITWVEYLVDTIVDEPILLVMCVAVPLVGVGVGLLNRLIHVN